MLLISSSKFSQADENSYYSNIFRREFKVDFVPCCSAGRREPWERASERKELERGGVKDRQNQRQTETQSESESKSRGGGGRKTDSVCS